MLLLLCTSFSFSFGFSFTITGKALPAKGTEIRWYSFDKTAEVTIAPDSSGRFTIKGQLNTPGEVQLKAFYKNMVYPVTFFLFAESSLQAEFNANSKSDFWLINGLCARCKAFEKAVSMANETLPLLTVEKAEKTVELYRQRARKIPGIAQDEYTNMHIDMQALSMLAGVVNTQKNQLAFSPFTRALFAPYLEAKSRYCSFSLYRSLQAQYLMQLAYDSAVAKQIRSSSIQISLFTATLRQLKKNTTGLPEALTAECLYNLLLDHKDPAFRDSVTIAQVKELCADFLQRYPAYPGRSRIELIQRFYTQPLLRNTAPELTLMDKKEMEFKLSGFRQRYVVLNLINPYEPNFTHVTAHLRQLQETFSTNKRVQLLYVHAYSDQRQWLKLMRADTSSIRWLLPMESDYLIRLQVTATPVTYIISPKGTVIYKGHPMGITDELLKKFLTGRYD
jgi:hypothetical protein